MKRSPKERASAMAALAESTREHMEGHAIGVGVGLAIAASVTTDDAVRLACWMRAAKRSTVTFDAFNRECANRGVVVN